MIAPLTLSDIFSAETKRNPFAFYARLQEQGPLFHIDDVPGVEGAWVATRYEDVVAILKDSRFIKERQKLSALKNAPHSTQENSALASIWWRNMLTVDPPDHTRLRKLVSSAFTPRMIEQLRPRIQKMTDDLLDAVQEQGRMELINDFAYPLPINVICEMLGIPEPDRSQFHEWARALMKATNDPRETMKPASAAVQEAFIHYIETFIHYIQRLLAEKRSHPGSDLVSNLVHVQDQGDTLNENELISTIWLLIAAGHETTVNLIGNSVLALLQHADQMHELQNDPSLLSPAIEELLRYAGPVMIGDRWASEDVTLHGHVIRKGEMMLFSLIGANLDPQQFPDPEDLDIARQVNKHVAFGRGIHTCLGAPLARLEGQIALGTLLRRMPQLRLGIEPEQLIWAPIKFRSLVSLPVVF